MNNQWLVLFSRMALGGILIAAGTIKLLDLGEFVRTVEIRYGTLPEGLMQFMGLEGFLRVMGVVLPGVELVCGVLILFGVFLRPAACASIIMAAIFMAANAMELAAGAQTCPNCLGEVIPLRSDTAILIDCAMVLLALGILFSRARGPTIVSWLRPKG